MVQKFALEGSGGNKDRIPPLQPLSARNHAGFHRGDEVIRINLQNTIQTGGHHAEASLDREGATGSAGACSRGTTGKW